MTVNAGKECRETNAEQREAGERGRCWAAALGPTLASAPAPILFGRTVGSQPRGARQPPAIGK